MSMPSESGGGTGMIPLCEPEFGGNEWKYVKDCLDTNWVSSVGAYVTRFEEQIAQYTGAKHAVATVNGTAALHIAMLVAGVRAGDEVLVPSLTFIATANAVRYVGAHPVFVDAEPDYWQMDPARVAEFLENECSAGGECPVHRATGRPVRALVPVHVHGHPCDMDALTATARRHGLAVIEDATESLGARYRDRNAGTLGDAACFSFNGNKLITTGGGGMFVTDNAAWADRARYLTTQAKDDPLEYIHHEVGFNYRLTNIQAALGCAQMERIGEYVETKRRIARRYNEALAGAPGLVGQPEAPWAASACWMYTLRVDAGRYGMDSRELLRRLRSSGIQTRPLWQPLHCSPAYPDAKCVGGGTVAERLNREGLSLPCSVGLTSQQQDRVIETLIALAPPD